MISLIKNYLRSIKPHGLILYLILLAGVSNHILSKVYAANATVPSNYKCPAEFKEKFCICIPEPGKTCSLGSYTWLENTPFKCANSSGKSELKPAESAMAWPIWLVVLVILITISVFIAVVVLFWSGASSKVIRPRSVATKSIGGFSSFRPPGSDPIVSSAASRQVSLRSALSKSGLHPASKQRSRSHSRRNSTATGNTDMTVKTPNPTNSTSSRSGRRHI